MSLLGGAVRRADNFYAGPAALPEEVLRRVQRDFFDYQGSGMNVMEMSHRSHWFTQIIEDAERDLRHILRIPTNYAVLFMQGGATSHFSAVPLNLLGDKTTADYVVTGTWSAKAAKEAKRYCHVNICARGDRKSIPPRTEWKCSPKEDTAYTYVCLNETVNGVEFPDVPDVDGVLVGDISSSFLSRPIDVTRFGLLYAGVQKNVGAAGVTVAIVRKDLLGRAHPLTPTMLDYTVLAKAKSVLNTPPTWAIYITGMVLQWIKEQGGLAALGKLNQAKANALYSCIEESSIFRPLVQRGARSRMNVVFRMYTPGSSEPSPRLERKFLQEAEKKNIVGLKGHRSVGGLRASIYNATSLEKVTRLIAFMESFELKVASKTSLPSAL